MEALAQEPSLPLGVEVPGVEVPNVEVPGVEVPGVEVPNVDPSDAESSPDDVVSSHSRRARRTSRREEARREKARPVEAAEPEAAEPEAAESLAAPWEDRAGATVPPPSASPSAPPRGFLLQPPSEPEMRARLRSLQKRVEECAGDWHGALETAVVFHPDGSVRALVGGGPSTEQRHCIQEVIRRRAQIRFSGEPTETTFTFRL
ncbi:MAG: hypothetical protein AAGE52_08255 [Myxococcota bacterium]